MSNCVLCEPHVPQVGPIVIACAVLGPHTNITPRTSATPKKRFIRPSPSILRNPNVPCRHVAIRTPPRHGLQSLENLRLTALPRRRSRADGRFLSAGKPPRSLCPFDLLGALLDARGELAHVRAAFDRRVELERRVEFPFGLGELPVRGKDNRGVQMNFRAPRLGA